MAVRSSARASSKLLDKHALQQAVAQLDERMGFIPDPAATPERAQALMLAHGVRPEDRVLSSEIIRMRHEKEGE